MEQVRAGEIEWPELDWAKWSDTAATLHMWTQIVGKTRLALSPRQAHWWHVPFYVSARGLSTSPMPCGNELLEIEFDFLSHALHFRLSSGARLSTPLREQSVAAFFAEYQSVLSFLHIPVHIHPVPVEVSEPIPFPDDRIHASYDPEYAYRFWRVLISADRAFRKFSSNFIGKISPVHFFWGSFDLAVTRFSGRLAPPREGADAVQREAYSHEVVSAGFWPGNGGFGEAAFYCYAAPVPGGLAEDEIKPAEAKFDSRLGEFLFRYRDLRATAHPEEALAAFLQSSYEAAAKRAGWDRKALERVPPNDLPTP